MRAEGNLSNLKSPGQTSTHPSLSGGRPEQTRQLPSQASPSLRTHPPGARMTLEAFAHLATVVTLTILVYVQAKPAVNRWAAIRYLRCVYEFPEDILVTPKEALHMSWARRLRRATRGALRGFALALMRQVDHIRLDTLMRQLFQESRRPDHLPFMEGCDPLVAEALFVSRFHLEDRKEQRRKRTHRKVRCAGGCGTRFGKRRRDHDFFGGEGIHGGWLCPTELCQKQATGDHYCGMCLEELRQASEVPQLPDTEIVPLDLSLRPEHPDLQDY